jgi:hypothetical protein
MAELADAADSKSAGTWYLGGSTPPPGTTINPLREDQLGRVAAKFSCNCDALFTGQLFSPCPDFALGENIRNGGFLKFTLCGFPSFDQ